MDTVIPRLHSSAPTPLSFDTSIGARAFLLERDQGNLLVYSSGGIEAEEQELTSLGGVSGQYLNHRHEASPSSDWIATAYEAPLHCHEDERSSVSGASDVGETFSERHAVGSDFEVIPTPGHTPGATAYLWDTGEHRCLFPGDTIMLRDGAWTMAILESSDRDDYIASLELIRELDFDLIVPWAAHDGEPVHAGTDAGETRRQIGAMLDRARRGESR